MARSSIFTLDYWRRTWRGPKWVPRGKRVLHGRSYASAWHEQLRKVVRAYASKKEARGPVLL